VDTTLLLRPDEYYIAKESEIVGWHENIVRVRPMVRAFNKIFHRRSVDIDCGCFLACG